MLLVLPVLLGVLGMHALVAPAAAPAPDATPTAAVIMADSGTTQHGPPGGAVGARGVAAALDEPGGAVLDAGGDGDLDRPGP